MSFAHHIIGWFKQNGRALPWRATRDPYAIWLSEIILQQTRIEQGRPYWERFMQRWPTVNDLAAASEDDVLRMWQGLGYYSRARNLHHAAKQIAAWGHFPDNVDDIKQLKGVGDYTAAAIASIAFGRPAAVVDGNVYRVLARHYGISTPINTTDGKKEFAALAQSLLPIGEASAFNQAMMDFGAIHCTPQNPQCGSCPVAETCVALHENRVAQLPVKLKKLKIQSRQLAYIYIRCQGYTAIHRRAAGDIWQGLWEPLIVEVADGADLMACVDETVAQLCQSQSASQQPRLTLLKNSVKHVLTHRIILADFYCLDCRQRPTLPDGYVWIRAEAIDDYGVPRLVELLLEAVNNNHMK